MSNDDVQMVCLVNHVARWSGVGFAHLHIALEEPLDVLVGGVLAQAGGEVLELVEEGVQALAQLAGLHRHPGLLLHLVNLLPHLRQLRPHTLQVLQLLQGNLYTHNAH